MSFRYRRTYRGPLRAVILDWAGTTCDHGCLAPAETFVAAFAASGVEITVAQARAPMGMAKWQHIKTITEMPSVAEAWTNQHGRKPGHADVDAIYERFLPLQLETVARYSALIPGTLEAVAAMRARGLKIGSTTGYPRAVMDVVVEQAREQGYDADCVISADDTPVGRPGPFPALNALVDMSVYPVEAVVKIGDTVVDIEEGLNGGMWSVGITTTGNEVGLSAEDWQSLDTQEQSRYRDAAERKLYSAGAHFVIDSIADILPVLDRIETALACGEKP
ncbi:MAG: phosphonoacetaldehyde hydrolase [Hyphomicrobiales bacterium]|nr:phosphonoacetaldehyde hydrolase [Hyphomicrobiales bacterium]